jgi:hypothetical protein
MPRERSPIVKGRGCTPSIGLARPIRYGGELEAQAPPWGPRRPLLILRTGGASGLLQRLRQLPGLVLFFVCTAEGASISPAQ